MSWLLSYFGLNIGGTVRHLGFSSCYNKFGACSYLRTCDNPVPLLDLHSNVRTLASIPAMVRNIHQLARCGYKLRAVTQSKFRVNILF